MSASLNRVMLLGNLTRDPELKTLAKGSTVCKLGIAVNRIYKNNNGEVVKDVQFFNVTVWGASGVNCAKFLAKGRPVLIEGRLQNSKYKTQSGEERIATDIVADNVQFLGGGDHDRTVTAPPTDESTELASVGDNEVPF